MLLQQVARIGLTTGAGMIAVKVLSPVVKLSSAIVGGTLGTVTDTITSVHKSINLGNQTIHRKADFAHVRAATQDEVKRIDLISLKRESLIKFGENTEAMKLRAAKLTEETQLMLVERGHRFPEV